MFRGIQCKILSLAVIIGLLPGMVGITLTYLGGTHLLKNSIGTNFHEIARKESEYMRRVIEKEIDEVHSLAISPFIRKYVEDENLKYNSKGNEEIIGEINSIENIWPRLKENSPILRNIMNNEVAEYIKEYKKGKARSMQRYLLLMQRALLLQLQIRHQIIFRQMKDGGKRLITMGREAST